MNMDPASTGLSIGEMSCFWRIVSEVPGLGVRVILYTSAFVRDPNNVYLTGLCPATGCYLDSFLRGIITSTGTVLSNEADILTDYQGNVLAVTGTGETYDIVPNPPCRRFTDAEIPAQVIGTLENLTFPEFPGFA